MSMSISELQSSISARQRVLDAMAGQQQALHTELASVETEIIHLEDEAALLERVAALLNSVGEERQEQAQGTIETLVSRGLQMIFDDTLSFHIVTSSRGQTSGIEFVVRSSLDGESVETPVLESRGGGLAATVGFLLRVVVMLLSSREGQENILVLDETFAHVSADYLEPLGRFLREVVDTSGIQIIMVTHQVEFLEYADVAYRFSSVNGRTQVVSDVS